MFVIRGMAFLELIVEANPEMTPCVFPGDLECEGTGLMGSGFFPASDFNVRGGGAFLASESCKCGLLELIVIGVLMIDASHCSACLTERAGAFGDFNSDSEAPAGIPLEFWLVFRLSFCIFLYAL